MCTAKSERPSAQPLINTSGHLLAQVSGRGGGGSKNLNRFSINSLTISGNSHHFLFLFSEKTLKNLHPRGQGGPLRFFKPQILFFL
jgi:hypothetical protein